MQTWIKWLVLLYVVIASSEASMVVTSVAGGLAAAIGQSYSALDGNIYFTEWSANRISYYNIANNKTGILYSGICNGVSNANPQDVQVLPGASVLGKSVLFVTCRNGDLFKLEYVLVLGWIKLKVNSVNLGEPHQLQLDPVNNLACKVLFK